MKGVTSGPTRRAVLAGGLALAGGVVARPWGAQADSMETRTILLVTVPGRRAEGAWERAGPLLQAAGRAPGLADWLIADGYRPAGFTGRLIAPAAVLDLAPARLARLLADPQLVQITSTRIPTRQDTQDWATAFAALLREPVDFASCVVAVDESPPAAIDPLAAALKPLATLRFA
ncbi:hypothetical protein NS365_03750 [Aureimonas ureilytica]|uniref:Uncharacterized protein n=1 Tax=Aureimonas ureilytica TaxID=401562 RepID=A0A175RVD4_9HYPH|nr:hypothetical protein [Aureimonas ureilytica]KTR07421.1 hypothetical protein NS365_03750 [Aureimonas ureilytica]